MEGVIIEGIGNSRIPLWCFDGDVALVDSVWHCCIIRPIPVGYAECHCGSLVATSLRRWVGYSNALGIVPKDLLWKV